MCNRQVTVHPRHKEFNIIVSSFPVIYLIFRTPWEELLPHQKSIIVESCCNLVRISVSVLIKSQVFDKSFGSKYYIYIYLTIFANSIIVAVIRFGNQVILEMLIFSPSYVIYCWSQIKNDIDSCNESIHYPPQRCILQLFAILINPYHSTCLVCLDLPRIIIVGIALWVAEIRTSKRESLNSRLNDF